jgi:hypothetical protein
LPRLNKDNEIRHIVLAGDSIFDNDTYVMDEPGVIEQMRRSIPKNWSASKVAIDGDCIDDIPKQLTHIPSNATDLIVSIGGNDARRYRGLIDQLKSPSDLANLIAMPLQRFRADYRAMLQMLKGLNLRLCVCAIYTAIPFTDPVWRKFAPLAIGAFNTVIIAEAKAAGIPVIRLDELCTSATDFSATSPIEPSSKGGQKIVDHILDHLVSASSS